VIPLILLGPGGVYVIHVTTVKGFFEAKGDQWNTVANGAAKPATINLLMRVSRFARAVQVYLERINVDLKTPVEPILIATDPGAHIESMRPLARVVQSDAIKQFANSVLQARPVWRLDYAYSLADIIIDPAPPDQRQPVTPPEFQSPGDRAQAIFDASHESNDPDNLGFGFEEEQVTSQPAARSPQARGPRPSQRAPQKNKIMGLTVPQLAMLGAFFICELVMVGVGAYIYLSQ
jgi:hypothetical protein